VRSVLHLRYQIKYVNNMTIKIKLSPSKNSYQVMYSLDDKNYLLHKGFPTLDEAMKEVTRISGSIRLLNDFHKR
jgi:hypothetical protein